MIRAYKNSSNWPRMSVFILLVVFFTQLIFASKPGYTQDSTAGSFEFEGHMREYEVFFPHNFQPNMPLVVNIHGWSETIDDYKKYTLLHEAADTSGFIVVYPQGLIVLRDRKEKQSWNVTSENIDSKRRFPPTDDVGFISALIDTMHARYDIDLARVYCCGYSTGGEMTFRMAGECGQRFAAVAAVASTLFDDAYNWQRIHPMPVMQIHGTSDNWWFPYYDGREGMWPISDMLNYWTKTNQCIPVADTTFIPNIIIEDNTTVQKISFTNCNSENVFIHYKIIYGGHSWPGSTADKWWVSEENNEGNRNMDISANVEILNFFKKYQNPLAYIAFGKSTEIVTRYVRPDSDALRLTAQIANPENHAVTVYGRIKNENASFRDSIQLFDDGHHQDGQASDNIWGGAKWLSDIDEELFEVRLRTHDLEEGTIHDMQLSGLDYFTTVGPLRFDSYEIVNLNDTTINPGETHRLKFRIENRGQIAIAKNITAWISSLDTFATVIGPSISLNFGNINAGNTILSSSSKPIKFSQDFKGPIDTVRFALEIASDGVVFWRDSTVQLVVGVEKQDIFIPESFSLKQNYPNPFNPSTMINYQLPINGDVELSIYNLLGQKVATLVNEKQNPGHHQVEWDASGFASGIYYYRIEAGEFRQVKKMILLK